MKRAPEQRGPCLCTMEHLAFMLRQHSDRERLAIMAQALPPGYVISSPEREESIWRMEATLKVLAEHPVQYSRFAVRPSGGG